MSSASSGSTAAQAFFRHLVKTWQACGTAQDIDTVLAGAGISQEQVERGEPPVHLRNYFRALQIAAPLVVDTGFFAKLGHTYNLFDLGILGYALYSAPNLRSSWDISLGQSSGLVPHPIMTRRRVSDEFAGIVLHPPEDAAAIQRALCEEWLFGTWRWMCQRLPELNGCDRAALHLAYPSPSYRHLYETLFPGKVRFNRPETALWIPRAYYEKPFDSANTSIMRLCYQKSLVGTAQPDNESNLAAEVRFYLLQNARPSFPDIKETATTFRIPPHTLHRRLARQDTTFRRVKLEVKMLLAKRYLKETTLSLQVISHLLGYGQTTSFSRAFHRWYNMTPSRFRNT